MADSLKSIVNVAIGVLQREDGFVLLAERPRHKVSGGYWEFPGGKFELNEDAFQALQREVREEVGVEVDQAYPWLTYTFDYPKKRVRLHVFRVTAWHGTPSGQEGQRIAWEDPHAVSVQPLLPANNKVLRAITLEPIYAITHASKYGIPEFMRRLEDALRRGVRLIQVRELSMTPDQYVQFARRVVVSAHRYNAQVLVSGSISDVNRSAADGMHVLSSDLMRLNEPPPVKFWSASCHNAEELQRAVELNADFVVVSQVLPTSSHPDEPGLGWGEFEKLTRNFPLPVYALGGMKPELLETAMQHNAHGVCLKSGIW